MQETRLDFFLRLHHDIRDLKELVKKAPVELADRERDLLLSYVDKSDAITTQLWKEEYQKMLREKAEALALPR